MVHKQIIEDNIGKKSYYVIQSINSYLDPFVPRHDVGAGAGAGAAFIENPFNIFTTNVSLVTGLINRASTVLLGNVFTNREDIVLDMPTTPTTAPKLPDPTTPTTAPKLPDPTNSSCYGYLEHWLVSTISKTLGNLKDTVIGWLSPIGVAASGLGGKRHTRHKIRRNGNKRTIKNRNKSVQYGGGGFSMIIYDYTPQELTHLIAQLVQQEIIADNCITIDASGGVIRVHADVRNCLDKLKEKLLLAHIETGEINEVPNSPFEIANRRKPSSRAKNTEINLDIYLTSIYNLLSYTFSKNNLVADENFIKEYITRFLHNILNPETNVSLPDYTITSTLSNDAVYTAMSFADDNIQHLNDINEFYGTPNKLYVESMNAFGLILVNPEIVIVPNDENTPFLGLDYVPFQVFGPNDPNNPDYPIICELTGKNGDILNIMEPRQENIAYELLLDNIANSSEVLSLAPSGAASPLSLASPLGTTSQFAFVSPPQSQSQSQSQTQSSIQSPPGYQHQQAPSTIVSQPLNESQESPSSEESIVLVSPRTANGTFSDLRMSLYDVMHTLDNEPNAFGQGGKEHKEDPIAASMGGTEKAKSFVEKSEAPSAAASMGGTEQTKTFEENKDEKSGVAPMSTELVGGSRRNNRTRRTKKTQRNKKTRKNKKRTRRL